MGTYSFLSTVHYLLTSRHSRGHGIHSPFLYRLITEVFRNKNLDSVVSKCEAIRKRMLHDKRIIDFEDMGAGSTVMTGNRRRVSSIARYSSLSKKYCTLLASLSAEFAAGSVLELGTSLGISTLYLALGSPDSEIVSVEGCRAVSEIANANYIEAGATNARSVNAGFDHFLESPRFEQMRPGLVFIDGNHRKDALLKYFNIIKNNCSGDSVIVIDDIRLSKEMNDAWNEIKYDNSVAVSVDIGRMGLLFFRRGLTNQHYIIRC
jgi:predicted O-methyltransferase YrrM